MFSGHEVNSTYPMLKRRMHTKGAQEGEAVGPSRCSSAALWIVRAGAALTVQMESLPTGRFLASCDPIVCFKTTVEAICTDDAVV